MSNMKCPFCQHKLVRHWGMKEPALYCCDNPKCSRGGVATESAWQELIRTRKALEIAVDALKRLEKELYFNNAKQTGHIADSVISIPSITLEQITALEQKDKR